MTDYLKGLALFIAILAIAGTLLAAGSYAVYERPYDVSLQVPRNSACDTTYCQCMNDPVQNKDSCAIEYRHCAGDWPGKIPC